MLDWYKHLELLSVGSYLWISCDFGRTPPGRLQARYSGQMNLLLVAAASFLSLKLAKSLHWGVESGLCP